MNNKFAFLLGLGVGAALGVGASWRLLKSHYRKIAEEEIESVQEWYREKIAAEKPSEKETEGEEPQEETEEEKIRLKTEYSKIAQKYDTSGVITVEQTRPYTIRPEEFGARDDYKTETLSYYADGVLAYYTSDDIVEEVGALVGGDALNSFGEYEDDAVFVRNEATKTDYEIIRDPGNYKDLYAGTSAEE